MLDTVAHYHIEFDSFLVQFHTPTLINFTQKEVELIGLEVEKLLEKRAIDRCNHEENEFISNIFITPKKDLTSRD